MTNPIDDIINEPESDIINRVLAQAPGMVTDSALDALIAKLRQDRALFIKAEQSGGSYVKEQAPEADDKVEGEDSSLG